MAVSWTTIPNELKDAILAETPFRDVLSVSITCKAWRAAALRTMYRSLEISCEPGAQVHWLKVEALLRVLRDHRNYPAYIEHLSLGPAHFEKHTFDGKKDYERDYLYYIKGMRNNASVERAMAQLHLPIAKSWYEMSMQGENLYAFALLVVMKSTHLKSLTMHTEVARVASLHHQTLTGLLISAIVALESGHEVAGLTRLERFKMDESLHDRPTASIEVLQLLLYLPKLSSLAVKITEYSKREPGTNRIPDFIRFWPFPDPPLATNLRTLRLYESDVSAHTMRRLLKQTSNLGNLSIDCSFPYSMGSLDLNALREGLAYIHYTLSCLEIRYEFYHDEQPRVDPETLEHIIDGSLGSLQHFTALTELHISLAVLYGEQDPDLVRPIAELLPSKLKRLTINDNFWEYESAFPGWTGEATMTHLKAFLDGNWKTTTPLLHEFTLDINEVDNLGSRWADPAIRREMRDLCKKQGLPFNIHHCFDFNQEEFSHVQDEDGDTEITGTQD